MAEDRSDEARHARAHDTAYTSQQAETYDAQRFVTASGKLIHDLEYGELSRALKYVRSGASTLEVGCGTGRLAIELSKLGYDVAGIDASGAMLDELQEKFKELDLPVTLKLAEAAALPFPDNSHDLVYSIRVLNQTESPEYALKVIREIIRVAKPGGYTLIEFVNEYRPRWGKGKTPTTRVRPADAVDAVENSDAKVISFRGRFFLGMQAFQRTPDLLLAPLSKIDRAASHLFPRLCSRCYIFAQKSVKK